MTVKRRDTDRLWPDFLDYFRQDFRREVHGWKRVLQYFGLYIPVLFVALVGVAVWLDPLPPKTAYLAAGQPGTSYHFLAEKFADYFEQHGVMLQVVETQGLGAGLRDLASDESSVNASFLTGGVVSKEKYPDLVSLGSIKYSPVWLFYRGEDPDPDHVLTDLTQRKIGVGGEDSNSQQLLSKLLGLHGLPLKQSPNVFALPHSEAIDRFERGELDAVFIVDGIDSPNIQRLLKIKDRKIADLALADAYIKQLPFLEKVTLPRGAVDINAVFPKKDINLLATTVTLAVEKSMHPALQWLYLQAAEKISRDRTEYFARPGKFPDYVDQDLALSSIGEQYYNGGLPWVFKILPNSLATLIQGTWGIVLACLTLAWPLFKWTLSLRQYPSGKHLFDYWQDLRDLDHDLDLIETPADAQLVIDQLDEMHEAVLATWIEDDLIPRYFGLRKTIEGVRHDAVRRLQATQSAALAAVEASQAPAVRDGTTDNLG